MMKSCELCKSKARIYCDSDQANLCWTCDSKVHSANFLVARHSRNLLCRVCQSPTPWTASGEKLGPSAVSVCDKCVVHGASDDREEESHGVNDVDVDVDVDVDDEYDGDEDGEIELDNDEDDGDDDVQVVPLCCTPPPASSSSSSDDISVSVKRKRENVLTDLSSSEDDVDCCSEMRGKRATLYQFLPSSSEEKMRSFGHREEISVEKECGAVGVCKETRAVGLDLNLID